MIDVIRQIRHHRIFRFVIVGVANATLHFSILNATFYLLNQGKLVSSIIATVCAVTFSFVMNRNFVFADKSTRAIKQLVLFIIITLTGMLLIHNAAYALTLNLLNNNEQFIVDIVHTITGVTLSNDFVDINVSTVVGAIFAMVWNYNGYKWFVFKDKTLYEEDPEAA